jgi:flagellar motility protein MotE (MotC chaperone)
MTPRLRLLPSVMVAASALLGVKLVDLWSDGSAAIAAASAQTPAATPPAAAPAPAATPVPKDAASATPLAPGAAPPTQTAAIAPATPPAPEASKAPDPLQLSSQEIDELQQLSQRRIELDKRAADLNERDVLMQATEKRIDDKIAKLDALQKSIQGSVKQEDAQDNARVQSLAHMYEQMKPQDAARILDQLDVPVVITLLSMMRELKASPILAAMDPAKAKEVTLALTDKADTKSASAVQAPAPAPAPQKAAQ